MPALLLLFVSGIAWYLRQNPAVAKLLFSGGLLMMLASDVLLVPLMYRWDLKQVLADLRQQSQPGDVVLIVGSHAVQVFRHYHDQDSWLDHVLYLERPEVTEPIEAPVIAAQARAVLSRGSRLWTVAFPPETYRIQETLPYLASQQRVINRVQVQAVLWLRRPA